MGDKFLFILIYDKTYPLQEMQGLQFGLSQGRVNYWIHHLQPVLRQALAQLEMVPESVWESLPLTVISTVLSLIIIPWSLLKIDDFFQNMADQSAKRKAKQNRRQSARIYHQQQATQVQQQQQRRYPTRK